MSSEAVGRVGAHEVFSEITSEIVAVLILALILASLVALAIGCWLASVERRLECSRGNEIMAALPEIASGSAALTGWMAISSPLLEASIDWYPGPDAVRARAGFAVEFTRGLAALFTALRPRSRSTGAFLVAALALVLATVLGVAILRPAGAGAGAAASATETPEASPTPTPGTPTPATPSPGTPPRETGRLSSATRVETAVAISRVAFPRARRSSTSPAPTTSPMPWSGGR